MAFILAWTARGKEENFATESTEDTEEERRRERRKG
jgi:hypothetical protein